MPDTMDFKKELDCYRARAGRFHLVDVPDLQYLQISGCGDPNTSPAYRRAIESLYAVAYGLKFASRRRLDRDYVVMPLEGLWWAEDMEAFTSARDKSKWHWTLMIMVPDWIDHDLFAATVEQVIAKKNPPRVGEIRLQTLSEGLSVQTLHIGRFDDEAAVLARMHDEFLPAEGLRMTGWHHEIYLGDPRRAAPERLRTILRQPVRPAAS